MLEYKIEAIGKDYLDLVSKTQGTNKVELRPCSTEETFPSACKVGDAVTIANGMKFPETDETNPNQVLDLNTRYYEFTHVPSGKVFKACPREKG
jgi:hypothetical protein